MSSSAPLEIYPQEVYFYDIQPEQSYNMTICVRNLSSQLRRIRFTSPKTSRFSAKKETLGALAVGLATNVEVSFETDTPGDFHDEIVIHSEGYEYILLLHALSSKPEILYEPFVNLGFTTINRPATGSVLFRNEGKTSGEVTLRYDKQSTPELTIVPENFTLMPKGELAVALSFKARDVSTFRCVVDVEIEGTDTIRHLDINANCVEQQMALLANSLEQVGDFPVGANHMTIASSLDFRTMYHGQQKEIQAFLVNVGPFPVRYQVKFVQGSEEEAESEAYLLMTPQELANQSIKRVIDATPLQGEVPSFSQLPITFTCNAKKHDTHKGFQRILLDDSHHYQLSWTVDTSIDYFYTAMFVFAEVEQKLTVQLQARAVLPNVKISDLSVHFYECPVREQRDYLIRLENMNEELPIDFTFSKVANFSIAPDHGILLPLQTYVVNVTFKPSNFGVFEAQSELSFLQGAYSLHVSLYGQSSTEGVKSARARGPDGLAKDFEPLRRYISTEDIARATQMQPQQWLEPTLLTTRMMSASDILHADPRAKSTAFLKESRNERLLKAKTQRLASLSQTLPRTLEEIKANTDFCLSTAPVPSKLLMLPPPRDPLYVEKPMGKYDTAPSAAQEYNHDPDKPIKNVLKRPIDRKRFEEIPFNERPQKQLEVNECAYALTPQDMHFISAGPKEINYEKMVIRAASAKWFSVVNDLKQHILVELIPTSEEVHHIDPPSLVIPPGQKGGFRVVLMSGKKQKIMTSIKYVINGKYEFNFRVIADVEPAVLEIMLPDASSSLVGALFLNFRFDDENLEESLVKTVNVNNKCGAPTKFTWTTAAESCFSVDPAEDIIDPFKQRSVSVTFTPGIGKNNEETLILKVENGESQALNCRGEIIPSECYFPSKNVDFGMVAVGVRTDKLATLKNNKPKFATFHVKKVPAQLEISPMKGRIPGDGKFPLKLTFISLLEEEVTEEIEVSIRGGKLLRLTVHANAIIPQIYIQEPDINFGGVTVGSQVVRQFTLINESPIPTVLYLNLEEHPEFDITLETHGDGDNESAIVANATGDKESPFYIKEEDEDEEDPKPDIKEDESEEENEEEEEETHRKYRITIAATRTVTLALRFSPKETDIYQFTLPFFLAGINQTVSGLQRTVSGEGLKPRFYVEKTVVDFDKKVISLQEKSFPVFRHPLISNPEVHPVKWRVDTSGIDKSLTFAIKPNEGILEPGNFSHMHVSFNPTQPVPYEEHVNLYLDGASEPYMTLTLLGQGTVPRILFDRREVILPIVPLNIPAKVLFYIINDGYENVDLEYKIIQDAIKLDISLNFPDGRQLGTTKQRLAVEAVFQSPKPISFTARVDFMDSEKMRYPIALSGTADNSLLTVFPFVQRNMDEVRFEVNDLGVINLVQDVQSETEDFSEKGGKPAGARTSGSSVVSRSAKSIIGFNPVPQQLLERSLDFLTRWLNAKFLATPINRIPEDMIESNGSQIYEIITTLVGKSPPGQAKLANVTQREIVKKLVTQYDVLLKWLKENGALLNTIRPEYLLSMTDFGRYLKSTPEQLQLKPKQIERRFPYLSADSWITLLYQILRVFVLGRLTPKSFKALPGMNAEAAAIETAVLQSNVYSLGENILLKWLTYHFSSVYPMTSRKVRNFDQDLLDGTVLAAVVQSHLGAVGSLQKVKFNALSDEQKRANIERVLAALNENGLPPFVLVKDFSPSQISAREMVLFVTILYHTLPQFISKTTIEFPCILGERLTKMIHLTNPASKPITYWVKLEGSSDFQLDYPDEFTIPAKATEPFPIHFQSRLSNSITAKLRFTNRTGDSTARAAAMVFMLVSKVVARKSEKVVETESSLYELTTKEVEVKNTFGKDAEFTVQLTYPEKEHGHVPKKAPHKRQNQKKVQPTIVFPPPFYLKNDRIKVKKGLTNILSVQFLPFEMERQEAYLIFVDENVGEMQYSIVGSVLPPKVDKQDKFELKREMGNSSAVEIAVSTHNHLLESAKREVMSRYQSAAKTKERENLKEIFKNLTEEINTFEVSINSPFFSGPSAFTITDASKSRSKAANLDTSQASILDGSKVEDRTPTGSRREKTKKKSMVTNVSQSVPDKLNMLALGFTPRQPGDYVCQVSLVNTLKTDFRALDILVSVKPKKARISLEMTTTARNVVTQDVPITNGSEKDWNVKVRLIQEGDAFSVSRDFIVRKKTTGNCVVTFKPDWVCQVTARLEIDVVTTGEVYEFELFGKCEEPRAEEHIVLQCRVKEKTLHYISIPNPRSYPVNYRVESDAPYATGDSSIEVPPYGTRNYELSFYPLQSGTYTGSITFKDSQNRFYWYTLEVHCATPEPEAVRELRVSCRKALEFKITVYNPLNEDTVFDVNVVGEGLYGDQQFSVPAKETGLYTLTYSPLLPAQGDGAISFLSEKTGEFWYRLRLICDPAEPIEKELFECSLGKSIAKSIQLENPSSKEVVLDYYCTNTLNFELIPDQVILPAYGAMEALIKYTPTSLKAIETAEIRLNSKNIGDWIFRVKGKGMPPSEMEPMIVTAGVNETNSVQIPFKNPFRDPLAVVITLETNHEEAFQLLLRRAKFAVGGMNLLMIPVAFKPQNMEELSATVLISASEELTWRFPLRGITERPSNKIDFVFKTKCRASLEKEIEIQLPDLVSLAEDENFTHELQVQSPSLNPLVLKSFYMEPRKNILSDPNECLTYAVKFDPLKPFKTEAQLFIYKASGGRWKFNMLIEAKEPDVDDTIVIEAPMGKITSVSFRLANHFKQYAAFTAHFTEESDPCFTVTPSQGILEPYGKAGTQFLLTFTPSEYGAARTAKLIVTTEEMQWSYLVRGVHPLYKPPEVGGGRLDNRLSRELKAQMKSAQKLSKKNFIRDNIRTQRSPKRSNS